MSTKGSVSFTIKESDRQIEKLILDSIAKEMDADLTKIMSEVRNQVKKYTPTVFKRSLTYRAIKSGELNEQLGFFPGQGSSAVDDIISTIVDSIKIEKTRVKHSNKGFVGGLSINVLLENYRDILSLKGSQIVTEKGIVLPWLDWLLKQGDLSVVLDYIYSPTGGTGRAGGGIMISSPGSAWTVPAQHSGTSENNWLTRALRDYEQEIVRNYSIIINRELRKVFR